MLEKKIFTQERNIDQSQIEFERNKFFKEGNFLRVNKIFGYKLDGNILKIQLAPAYDCKINEKINLLNEAMQKIAIDVNSLKFISEISATSWIVAEKPKMLKKMGFTIQEKKNTLKDKLKDGFYFSINNRPIASATMSREDFLKKYLSQPVKGHL